MDDLNQRICNILNEITAEVLQNVTDVYFRLQRCQEKEDNRFEQEQN